jgi:hypothetical protein
MISLGYGKGLTWRGNDRYNTRPVLSLEGVMVNDTILGGQGDPVARTVEDQEETLKKAYEAGVTLVNG